MAIFLLLVAVGSWIYLMKRTESTKYADGLKDSLHSALSASETQVDGFSRSQGRLVIDRLMSQGGRETFFNTLEARNIGCKMSLLDGVSGQWDTGVVSISTLNLELRPGADDAESAKALSDALFRHSDKVLINTIEVGEATLNWGYSERTRGTIEGSAMTASRIGAGWRLTFKGGTFSQNWLRKLEIVNLVVLVDPDGMTFEKADFRRGQGTVDASGIKLAGGESPVVSGTVKFRMLALDSILPVALRNFVEGSISGNFILTGSTNSSEGLEFEGRVTLDDQDSIVLRERIPLLEALSVVDYARNYHRTDFREGSFHLKTGNGGAKIADLKLKAQDVLILEGNLLVRMPNVEELKEDAKRVANKTSLSADEPPSRGTDATFSLARAGKATNRGKAEASPDSSMLNRLGVTLEKQHEEQRMADLASQALRYQGSFVVSLLPDSFERAPKLLQKFPVDARTGRISMVVPVQGTLYQLTVDQAQEIYQQRAR